MTIKVQSFSSNVKVACILDELPYHWLKYHLNLVTIEPYNWKEVMEDQKPDLLLVQSAWHGYKNKWELKIASLKPNENSLLKQIVSWCKKNNIPTAFWNIDDSYMFNTFIQTAKLFDFIFTTDENCIKNYKEKVGHNNVYTLPMAAQPNIHNPINRYKQRLGKVAFAGSWYNIGYETRKKDIETLVKPSINFDLHIYDRLYDLNSDDYRFPKIYQPYIRGGLPYEDMMEMYKKYDVFLNVNTVQDSPTMFSCRVFELLGCGVNTISGYALGVEKMFPNIVLLSKSKEQTTNHIRKLLNNQQYADKLSLLGLREVFKKHTYAHRLEYMFSKIGLDYKKTPEPNVSFICVVNSNSEIKNAVEIYTSQNYKFKELILILRDETIDIDFWKNNLKTIQCISILKSTNKNFSNCLNMGVYKSSCQYVTFIDPNDYYSPHFITDLINGFKYTDADIVGKQSHYVYYSKKNILLTANDIKEFEQVNSLLPSALVANKSVFDKIRFSEQSDEPGYDFIKACLLNSIKLFSSDRFNYISFINGIPYPIKKGMYKKSLGVKLNPIKLNEGLIKYVTV
ncbi:glycosyltransferase family protein [Sporosalibacterium faouarense]|uniref:glycosyltransferase family protein n=1 Tax=Sporosalibacterium faouarense TaxID=516123 RepID=UPI00192BBE2F|nr:glycosyltransferase [Sporosalibacterium faouarense]